MAPTHLHAMPRRHPLPLPARPASLARLRELQLTGATTRELSCELQRDPDWALRVAGLERSHALGLGVSLTPGAFSGLALAGALLCELDDGAAANTFEGRRRSAQALVGARLCARLAPRLPRPLGVPTVEFFCLPLVQACAFERVERAFVSQDALARESARLAAAWGLSGQAIEALELWGHSFVPSPEHTLATALQLALRLAENAGGSGPTGPLAEAASLTAARALGLRPADLAELDGCAVAWLAEGAA